MAAKKITHSYDVLIAGSGFAGSLTALILAKLGYKVCLVEKKSHPRFAIGESSTPIADMVIRDLAKMYGLPWLFHFSRYGSWQRTYPEIGCGLKRGFSYFFQTAGEAFSTDENHKNELLVAASVSDLESDTNWLRADMDAFLVGKVQASGIPYMDRTVLAGVEKTSKWRFHAIRPGTSLTLEASFFLDATGTPDLLQSLFHVASSSDGFLTDSYAIYSHFDGVSRWMDVLHKNGIPTKEYPYDADHSALHHLLEEGWAWMLRFNNDQLSMGLVLDANRQPFTTADLAKQWHSTLGKYPSLALLMEHATLSAAPGKIFGTGRLQRKAGKGYGDGWAALPHTMGFVDPLHSTGIAHSLCGVEKIARIFSEHRASPDKLSGEWEMYAKSVMAEINFIDLLVAGSYRALRHFELFHAWTTLYFIAAIGYEQKRLNGQVPNCFLMADNHDLRNMVEMSYADLEQVLAGGQPTADDMRRFTERIRARIAPYNIAGLLDPSARNMYQHTAADLG